MGLISNEEGISPFGRKDKSCLSLKKDRGAGRFFFLHQYKLDHLIKLNCDILKFLVLIRKDIKMGNYKTTGLARGEGTGC